MSESHVLSFPGLGIGEFTMDPVAFEIFGRPITWYGIVITFGIIMAILYSVWRGKRSEKIVFDDYIDLSFSTIILGVIGARLYYVLTTLGKGYYKSFWKVFAIWEGGLAIYGALLGGIIGLYLGCRIKKLPWKKVFDSVGPGVMLAQSIGRWGNFFNGEAYGNEIGSTTLFDFFTLKANLPSGEGTLFHFLRMGVYPNDFDGKLLYFHPTFFYEIVWNLLGFVLINLFYKHKKYDGQIAVLYLSWYGFGRVFVEGFRSDSLYIPGTSLRISQCLGAFFFLAGICFLTIVFFRRKAGKKVPVVEDYTPAPAPQKAPKKQKAKETVEQTAAEPVETKDELQAAANESTEQKEESTDGNAH